MTSLQIIQGDALTELRKLPSESVHCCVTSPPYFSLRDYGVEGQMGLEDTPGEYIERMVEVFTQVRRVLRFDGTLWLNIGDCYSAQAGQRKSTDARGPKQCTNRGSSDLGSRDVPGLKPKDLVGVPWMLAFALRADGWWLRQDIIWHKPNPMPESVTDRCTKAHEYLFLLAKSARYFFDAEAIKEPTTEPDDGRERVYGGKNKGAELRMQGIRLSGNTVVGNGASRNKRSVWTVTTEPYSEAHFATFPPDLIKPCILAGTSARGCCPKCGAPWERVMESPELLSFGRGDLVHGKQRDWKRSSHCGRNDQAHYQPPKTTGWMPTCDNGGSQTVPCTVLDPFFGSGTTGMVSLELSRSCIGIELNPAYVKLAERRCHVTPGLQLA